MFKKIKAFFQKRKAIKEQKKKLNDAKEYYEKIRSGGLFIQYIKDDIKKTINKMNRSKTRRFLKSLEKKGKFSSEIILYYQNKVEQMLTYIKLQEMTLESTINKKTTPNTNKEK